MDTVGMPFLPVNRSRLDRPQPLQTATAARMPPAKRADGAPDIAQQFQWLIDAGQERTRGIPLQRKNRSIRGCRRAYASQSVCAHMCSLIVGSCATGKFMEFAMKHILCAVAW